MSNYFNDRELGPRAIPPVLPPVLQDKSQVKHHRTIAAPPPPITPDLVRSIFEESLGIFLARERQELIEGVNERNNCARWANYMERCAEARGLADYVADIEYNRKQNGQIKTIINEQYEIVTINCDLILHSRGLHIPQDNLLAIELKKRERPPHEKEKDRARLRALTRTSYNGIWVPDGTTPPEHVCGYMLGAYVEVDRHNTLCLLEYYSNGEQVEALNRAF